MFLLRKKHIPYLLYSALASSLVSFGIVKFDTEFSFRWIAFGLYLFALSVTTLYYICIKLSHEHFKKHVLEKEAAPAIGILIVALFINLLFIASYPFVSIADEMRDAGLLGMQIASGTLKNIWAYGSYGGYGLFIPTIASLFYYIFGSSDLTYRIPAAFASSFGVFFLYIFVRKSIDRKTALWASFILISLPLSIFFAHTELVVASSALLTPILLLASYEFLKKRDVADFIFLGMLLGFACNFHATIKAFASIILLLIFFLEIQKIIQHISLDKISQTAQKLLILVAFFIIGFGPLLLSTGPQEFFHSNRFSLEDKVTTHAPVTTQDATTMKNNYLKSLMVFFYETTSFHYHDAKPLLPPFLAIFFVLGLGYAFFVMKNPSMLFCIVLLFTVPFTNSTLTDAVNADHRLTPLLSLVAIFTAIGISYVSNKIRWKTISFLFGFIMLCYLSQQVFTFYSSNIANKDIGTQDTLLINALYILQNDPSFHKSPITNLSYMNNQLIPAPVCFVVSSKNFTYFNDNIRAQEPQSYFTPSADIHYRQASEISDNEIYILKKSCQSNVDYHTAKNTYIIACPDTRQPACPFGYEGILTIHY